MPVRRVYTENNSRIVYGSFGTVVTEPGFKTTHDMKDEIPYFRPYFPTIIGDFELAYAWMISFHWRWKYALISADLPVMQTYNAVTGKRRHGSCVVQQRNYVSDETFVAFDSQISPTYATGYVLVLGGGEDRLPCDEPPTDTEVTIVPNALWLASTYLGGQTHLFEYPNTSNAIIGDTVTFFPERSITGYIFGGSYVGHVVTTFTEDQFENQYGRPPVINL